jgi:hypothetical protein
MRHIAHAGPADATEIGAWQTGSRQKMSLAQFGEQDTSPLFATEYRSLKQQMRPKAHFFPGDLTISRGTRTARTSFPWWWCTSNPQARQR